MKNKFKASFTYGLILVLFSLVGMAHELNVTNWPLVAYFLGGTLLSSILLPVGLTLVDSWIKPLVIIVHFCTWLVALIFYATSIL